MDDNRPEEVELDADGFVVNKAAAEQEAEKLTCAQCEAPVPSGQEVRTENAVFCEPCFTQIKNLLETSLALQSQGINYLGAVGGGVIGGLLSALVWWGFVTLTNIQFGLVAVIIGWAVGKGVVILSGHKRALQLQLISVGLTIISYGMATYWVTRTFANRYYAEQGMNLSLPLIPPVDLYLDVVTTGFELFDLIFLAIALWQAWKMPAPIKLNT